MGDLVMGFPPETTVIEFFSLHTRVQDFCLRIIRHERCFFSAEILSPRYFLARIFFP